MALILVDNFSTADGTYTCKYDSITGRGSVEFHGTGGSQKRTVTEADRGKAQGEPSGQACDGTTLIEFFASLSTPFFTRTLTPNSATCSVQPAPSCDLMVVNINTTDETEVDEDDGSATISATSSQGNIQYSLDSNNFQYSNYFDSLEPGLYTAYLKDAGNCTAQKQFVINPFSKSNKTFTSGLPAVELLNGNISRWNAAFNPIVVTFQRKDYTVSTVKQSGTSGTRIAVTITASLVSTEFNDALLDAIYIKTPKYEYYGKASAHAIVNGLSVFTMVVPYIGDDSSGFANIPNNKPGYAVEVTIGEVAGEFTPDRTGLTRADISGFLQTKVRPVSNWNYNTLNYIDINLFYPYKVSCREVWDGTSTTSAISAFDMFATYAAMQLGQRYGGNMAVYVTFPTWYEAKFLSGFERPVYFQGQPFDLAFISSESINGLAIFMEIRPVDGGFYDAQVTPLIDEQANKIIYGSFEGQAELIYPITNEPGINRVNIYCTFNKGVKSFTARVYHVLNGSRQYITEKKTLRVADFCNGVYLRWINTLGAWDYFGFTGSHDIDTNVKNESTVSRNVLNWETQETINDVIRKSANDKLSLAADGLTRSEVEGLKGLKRSIKVQMMTEPYKWQTVVLTDGGFGSYPSRGNSYSVSFEITLADYNIQEQ